jgi:hypothetical protein
MFDLYPTPIWSARSIEAARNAQLAARVSAPTRPRTRRWWR